MAGNDMAGSDMAGGYEAQAYPPEGMPGGYFPGGPACDCGPVGGDCGGCCPSGWCCAPSCNWCDCCPYPCFSVGGGVYYVTPHWKTNPAFLTVTDGAVFTLNQTDFDYDMEIAPFAWAAYRTPHGAGIQAHAWWYDDSESLAVTNDGTLTVLTAAPLGVGTFSDTTLGDSLSFDSSLEIDVIDLLLTHRALWDCGSLEFGAGIRYARVEQTYQANVAFASGDIAQIDSRQHFEGIGPCFSLEGRLAATRRLTLFGTIRYCLLFGRAEQTASFFQNGVLATQASQENDDVRPVAELDLGAEYAVRIGCTELFISAALVSQVWQGAGNSSNDDYIEFTPGGFATPDKDADLGLWGLRTEAGVRF